MSAAGRATSHGSVAAALVVAIAAAGATEVSTVEASVADLAMALPHGLEPLWNFLYALAPIGAAALLVVALVGGGGASS